MQGPDSGPTRGLDEIAADLGFPIEAVQMVQSVCDHIAWRAKDAGMSEMSHVNAVGFCNIFCTQVRAVFGARASSVLHRWGVKRSEDVGLIVFALVAAEWILASDEDSIDDFAGLFTVDDYFV